MRTLLSRIAFRMKGAPDAPRSARLLRVTLDDDDGVIGVDDDWVMRTAPLGVANGAVVGVVPGCPSG